MAFNGTSTYTSNKVVPPLNFAMILPGEGLHNLDLGNGASRIVADQTAAFWLIGVGVYRSGHPNVKNFPFMDTLNLRSIM